MNTLMRVRGKRGNLKRKLGDLTQQRDEARQERFKNRQTEAERPSYLERLPVEILQRIFIESRSPRMAQASKRLQTQLLSDYTKLRMTIACFQELGMDDKPEVDWSPEDHFAIVQLLVLIRQKWFTFPLFQAARYEWLMETSVIEVANLFASEDGTVNKDVLGSIRNRIRSMFDWLLTEGRKGLSRAQRRIVNSSKAPKDKRGRLRQEDGDGVCLFTHGTQTAWVTFATSTILEDGLPVCDWNEICILRPGKDTITRHKFLVSIHSLRHIPPELVSAPFTQSKGDLLVSLLSSKLADGLVEHSPYDPIAVHAMTIPTNLSAAWEAGLLTALEQRCCPALTVLTRMPLGRLSGECHSNSVKTPPPLASDKWVTEPLSIWRNADHPYHKLLWSWNRCEANWGVYFRKSPMNATHVQLCATEMHHDPGLYLRILMAHCAGLPEGVTISTSTLNKLYQQSQRQADPGITKQIRDMYLRCLTINENHSLSEQMRNRVGRVSTMSDVEYY